MLEQFIRTIHKNNYGGKHCVLLTRSTGHSLDPTEGCPDFLWEYRINTQTKIVRTIHKNNFGGIECGYKWYLRHHFHDRICVWSKQKKVSKNDILCAAKNGPITEQYFGRARNMDQSQSSIFAAQEIWFTYVDSRRCGTKQIKRTVLEQLQLQLRLQYRYN